MMNDVSYWYCANCKMELADSRVTSQELCDTCGHPAVVIEGVDVDRLNELVEADKEGRCLVLPRKVGDTVYWPSIFGCGIREGKVGAIKLSGFGFDLEIQDVRNPHLSVKKEFEKVFLARAEAEAVLAKEILK